MAKEDYDKTEKSIQVIVSLIKQMLTRDDGWKEYYTSEMDTIDEDCIESSVYDRLLKERQAEQFFGDGEYEKAASSMQKLIDELDIDDAEKGWYLQQLARYTYPFIRMYFLMRDWSQPLLWRLRPFLFLWRITTLAILR